MLDKVWLRVRAAPHMFVPHRANICYYVISANWVVFLSCWIACLSVCLSAGLFTRYENICMIFCQRCAYPKFVWRGGWVIWIQNCRLRGIGLQSVCDCSVKCSCQERMMKSIAVLDLTGLFPELNQCQRKKYTT